MLDIKLYLGMFFLTNQPLKKYALILGILILIYSLFFGGPLLTRSLWLDEAMLANNIVSRSYVQLLQPLNFQQIAPPFYLLLTKVLCEIFGYSEVVLRSLSILAYLGSVIIFYKCAKTIFKIEFYTILSTLIFATNGHIIYFAVEFKPYIIDVFISLVLFFTALKPTQKNRLLFYTSSLLFVFFSVISPLVSFSVILFMFIKLKKDPIFRKEIVFYIPILTLVLVVYFYQFIYQHPHAEFMKWYWQKTFLDSESITSVLQWVENSFFNMFKGMYFPFTSLSATIAVLFAIGTIKVAIKNRKYLILIITPLLLHVLFNYFHLLPFQYRFTLYYWPVIFVVSIYSFSSISKINNSVFGKVFCVILLIAGIGQQLVSPLERQDVKTMLAELLDQSNRENLFLVDASIIPIYQYYVVQNEIEELPNLAMIPDCYMTEYDPIKYDINGEESLNLKSKAVDENNNIVLVTKKHNCNFQDHFIQFLEGKFEVSTKEFMESEYQVFYLSPKKYTELE